MSVQVISIDLLSTVERFSIDHSFQLVAQNGKLTLNHISQNSADHLSNINQVVNCLKTFYKSSPDPVLALRVSYVFYRYFKDLSKELPSQLDSLLKQALNIRFGYQVDFEKTPNDFYQFFKANNLQHIFPALNIAIHKPEIPIFKNEMVPWTEFSQAKMADGGIVFSYRGQLAFEVDSSMNLKNDYCITQFGIRRKGADLIPIMERNRSTEGAEGKQDYVVKAVVGMPRNVNGTRDDGTLVHAFFILKDPHAVYSFGKDWGGKEMLNSETHQSVPNSANFENPALSFLLRPKELVSFTTAAFYVDRKKFMVLRQRFAHDYIEAKNGKKPFLFLKQNCTTYVRDVMRDHLGIIPEIETELLSGLAHYCYPEKTRAIEESFYIRHLPKIMRKSMYYLASVVAVSALKIFCRMDYSWMEILKENCRMDSPLILSHWMRRRKENTPFLAETTVVDPRPSEYWEQMERESKHRFERIDQNLAMVRKNIQS